MTTADLARLITFGRRVQLQTVLGAGAPALRIGPIAAGTAVPATLEQLEVALLERAVHLGGLCFGEDGVRARRLIACFRVEEGSRAIEPFHRRVRARVVLGMSVAHSLLFSRSLPLSLSLPSLL